MERCLGINLPDSHGDKDLAILQNQIADPSLDVRYAVSMLYLDPVVVPFRKFLAITKIAKLNPTVSRIQEIFDMYLNTLSSLEKKSCVRSYASYCLS